jgi:hypothetical protein
MKIFIPKHPISSLLGISDRLLASLFSMEWQWECEIIPEYKAKYAEDDTSTRCVIRWNSHLPIPTKALWNKDTGEVTTTIFKGDNFVIIDNYWKDSDNSKFLRYSKGPGTGSFWDVYGDDYHSKELAFAEMLKVWIPPNGSFNIPTHGNIPDWVREKYGIEISL